MARITSTFTTAQPQRVACAWERDTIAWHAVVEVIRVKNIAEFFDIVLSANAGRQHGAKFEALRDADEAFAVAVSVVAPAGAWFSTLTRYELDKLADAWLSRQIKRPTKLEQP